MSKIDPSQYVRAPITDVAGAVSLGIGLLTYLPQTAPKPVKDAGLKLRDSVLALQAIWSETAVPTSPAGRRAADSAVDNAWGALEGRLASYARLPAALYSKAPRAAEIHRHLFAGGLDFLTLMYRSQWAESERRLHLVATKDFAADIDALAGPEFLAEVKRTQKLYGEALGLTKAEEAAPDLKLTEPLRAVGAAVVDYALQLLAWSRADLSVEAAVRRALKPIDDARAANRRSPAEAAAPEPEPAPAPTPTPEVGPQTPVPDIPA